MTIKGFIIFFKDPPYNLFGIVDKTMPFSFFKHCFKILSNQKTKTSQPSCQKNAQLNVFGFFITYFSKHRFGKKAHRFYHFWIFNKKLVSLFTVKC